MLFDSHLHFADELSDLCLVDIERLISEANELGVERFISNSTNLKTCKENVSLASNYDSVFAGIGIYPTELRSNSDLKKVFDLIEYYLTIDKKLKKKILVGEIGLDFKNATKAEQSVQEEGFRKQIEFAKEIDVFVEVHSRFAVRQTLELLKQLRAEKVIMHWYTNSAKYAELATKEGYFITVGPSYLYNHDLIYNNIKNIDKQKILFETDFPVEFDSKKQEPKVIKDIVMQYTQDFELDVKEIEKMQRKHFKAIFI